MAAFYTISLSCFENSDGVYGSKVIKINCCISQNVSREKVMRVRLTQNLQ